MGSNATPKEMYNDIRSATRAKSGGIRLSDWEQEFIDNVGKRILGLQGLTEKQAETLKAIWDRI